MRIIAGDFNNPQVRALLEHHVATARAETAAGSAHALDLESMKASDINFWAAWDGDVLLAVGALKKSRTTTARSSRCIRFRLVEGKE